MTTKSYVLLLAMTLLLFPLVLIPIFGFVIFLGLSLLFVPLVLERGEVTGQIVCSRFAAALWLIGGCMLQVIVTVFSTFGVPDWLGLIFALGATWGSGGGILLSLMLIRGWYWTKLKL